MHEPVREWYAQIAVASRTPGLAQHLVRRTGELLPCFVHFYDEIRALPRRLRRVIARRLSIAGLAMLLALCGGTLRAATIQVDETTCRLADAIVAANTDSATNGCPEGNGADMILLNSDVTLGASLPQITSALTIQAGTHSLLSGAGYACFNVAYYVGPVALDGVTVQGCYQRYGGAIRSSGTVTISGCTLSDNSANFGGAVYNAGAGVMTIEDSAISGNTSNDGAGGVFTGGSLSIVDSTITGNTARFSGGGIYLYSLPVDPVTLTRTVISGNEAGFDGGGIKLGAYANPTLHVTDCVISGNTAANRGGGIGNIGHSLDGGGSVITIFGSTISGNTAKLGGGFESYTYGDNSVRIEQTTISGNTATEKGGGVYQTIDFGGCYDPQYDDSLTLVNVTITDNEAGEVGGGVYMGCPHVSIAHSLVSGNRAPESAETGLERSTGVTVDGFNVVGYDGDARSTGFTPGPTDIVPAAGVQVEDILSPLADNGGPTPTHALVPGSPAIDAIPTSDSNCVGTFDQRGVSRPVGPGCDTGSFELEAAHVALGGSVTGFTPKRVVCSHRTTGQREQSRTSATSWDCEALGLAVETGDLVQTSATGVATASAIGGSVTRMTISAFTCVNVTTSQTVRSRTSATSWDCETIGLHVMPGDTVTTGASGTVD